VGWLGVVTVGRERADYYMADLGAEPDRCPPRWAGRGAAALGLRGPAGPGGLAALLAGEHPGTGRRLPHRPVAVAAYDLTFSAPKSVSLLAAFGGPSVGDEVVAAHGRAVGSALDYLEDRAAAARRSVPGGRVLLETDGLVGVAFVHHVSRALDPHLHTHLLVANAARGADGRFGTLDGRGLFAHGAAAGRLYGAHLRAELGEGLGVRWQRRPDGRVDVEGVDPVLLGAFSSRRAEIMGELGPGHGRSWRARRVAWAATREQKWSPDRATLQARWSEHAASLGLDPGSLHRVLDRPPETGPALDEHRFAAALSVAPASGVTRRDVVAAWCDGARPGSRGSDVTACVDQWRPAVDEARGVAEPRRAAAVPPPWLLGALGPRPLAPKELGLWRATARALERYRTRWSVDDPRRALGPDPSTAVSTAHLAERLAVVRQLEETRLRLGRRTPARERLERSIGRD